jgi:hypothetical protein
MNCLFTAYSMFIHCLFTVYPLPIHCLFTVYSLPVIGETIASETAKAHGTGMKRHTSSQLSRHSLCTPVQRGGAWVPGRLFASVRRGRAVLYKLKHVRSLPPPAGQSNPSVCSFSFRARSVSINPLSAHSRPITPVQGETVYLVDCVDICTAVEQYFTSWRMSVACRQHQGSQTELNRSAQMGNPNVCAKAWCCSNEGHSNS